jgi:hypothetical protein
MIGVLHRLKKDEEGQALVLGAIFALVLALCVLSTVSLGRGIYDKVQLQTAADAAAYSQAAVEARVLNFTAYTNRAMVVHYASIMAASAYLTWVHFLWTAIRPLCEVLQFVPYVGIIIKIIKEVMSWLIKALDVAVAALTPILSAANVILWGLQEGAWAAVGTPLAGRLATIAPEAHSGDTPAEPYEQIWPLLTATANQAVFARTRGHALLLADVAESEKILMNDRDAGVQLARAHMLEIANSARQPWVAYGDHWDDPSLSLFARHADFGFDIICSVGVQNVARTELGSPSPGTANGKMGQVFSGSRLQFKLDCPLIGSKKIRIFQVTAMDQVFPALRPGKNYEFRVLDEGGLFGKALEKMLGTTIGTVMDQLAKAFAPSPDLRAFWISPYVSFAPQARSTPGGATGDLGNFAQPDVIVGLAKEGRSMNRENGAAKTYSRKFASGIGGKGTTAAADLGYTKEDWPTIQGLPLLHEGLNAFAAAQVYYHRPGDWRETPNFFNPLWGARLMPIAESNAANFVPKLMQTPLVKQFLLH